ncbi:polysaccharide deacetylase family protein [Algoriphagus algorifonticola]|uniref:polysaccharide deacetylase family protein n=1 Tax=Algoriphagus algorifonticola TaxID=2593007 RepID=UPI0011A4B7B9|nr:polysaccharide deacetylase family protein [Algoriphagus algorifonticola]
MKISHFICFLLVFIPIINFAQSLQEKLGYAAEDKLLIIHGDDVGVSHSQNLATFQAIQNGLVTSTSMMVPAAWSKEVAELAKSIKNTDIGIHITLTNEWLHYNWGPEAGKTDVPGLVNPLGHMFPSCAEVAQNASPEQVEKEVRAQIESAKAMGIEVTHLDSHMGCMFYGRPEYMRIYVKLALEYNIPAMINQEIYKGFIEPNPALFEGLEIQKLPIIDQIIMADEKAYANGMEEFYTHALKNLPAGVHVLLLHLAFDDAEMNAVTSGHDAFHAPWRQKDYDFFTSEQAKKLLEEQHIKLITWREIGKVL